MTFEEIIEKCIGLRRAFERDEARFFLGLAEIESEHMDVLRQNECHTFDQFIRSHELTRPERYRAFMAGLHHCSPQEAESMGAPAVIALAKNVDAANVPAYKEAVSAWSHAHRGLTPRTETAERLLRQVDPRPEIPKAVREMSESQKLREEVKRLRRENASLKREIERLKAQIPIAAE